ncbi:MAG: AIR carboxylase family protein, partial [Polyangiaceae bacterium]
MAVAEEAYETLRVVGIAATRVYDVGVAGIHRFLSRAPELTRAAAVIVVAGMEGALPSVVGGLVAAPIIAVPTTVGYGTLGGFTALFSMLTSCASSVTVVNIDSGFGAAMAASMNTRRPSTRATPPRETAEIQGGDETRPARAGRGAAEATTDGRAGKKLALVTPKRGAVAAAKAGSTRPSAPAKRRTVTEAMPARAAVGSRARAHLHSHDHVHQHGDAGGHAHGHEHEHAPVQVDGEANAAGGVGDQGHAHEHGHDHPHEHGSDREDGHGHGHDDGHGEHGHGEHGHGEHGHG